MTKRIGVWMVAGLLATAACGSSGGSGPVDAVDAVDAADVPVADTADVPATDLPGRDEIAPTDVPTDTPATDLATDTPAADVPVPDVPATDPGPEAFEWPASPTPNCVDGACAAGPDSAPDPTKWGPFPVGLRRVVLVDPSQTNYDGTPRTLVTEIWYPTTKEFYDSHPKFTYDIKADAAMAPGYEDVVAMIGDVEVGSFPVDAVKDAPVRHGDGRYPLVMFSHGAFGIRYQSIFYTIPLASHGYIVVSPDHEKNDLYDLIKQGFDSSHLAESSVARPKDIRYLMDVMGQWDADPANDFYKTIGADNVGITGHSFGGFTCFAAAYPSDENGWSEMDPRVKAIVPQAPAGYLMGALGIYGPDWHLPTLIEGGELDNTLEYQQAFKDPWDTLGTPKWFLDVKRGGHFTFSDICRMNLLEVAENLGYDEAKNALTDGCGVENWDYREAQVAINQYSIAMFNRYLRGSTGSAAYMDPATASAYDGEVVFLSQESVPDAR
jgi:predicted dienelactone hydrolase